ncbi:hypothetical protein ACFFLS_04875 [Flavobacterium procerum]|uniref:Lipoprotein n=1 Tax=Flavobacterium procerum TaxID=1455569 RepID=A0ABV6BLQ2_9FLAO
MKKLTTNTLLCLILTLISCNQNPKPEKTIIISNDKTADENIPKRESFKPGVRNLPNELSAFIPTNYSVLDTASGDLNLDKIKDYIVVLKKNREDTLSDVVDNPERRPLLILLSDKENKLKLARRNDNTVYCIDCGGMLGDPFMGITIKNGYFSVEHYGGSNWRWKSIITYKYSKTEKEWFLYKDGLESFQISDTENVKTEIKTAKDFGRVKFQDFDIYKD